MKPDPHINLAEPVMTARLQRLAHVANAVRPDSTSQSLERLIAAFRLLVASTSDAQRLTTKRGTQI